MCVSTCLCVCVCPCLCVCGRQWVAKVWNRRGWGVGGGSRMEERSTSRADSVLLLSACSRLCIYSHVPLFLVKSERRLLFFVHKCMCANRSCHVRQAYTCSVLSPNFKKNIYCFILKFSCFFNCLGFFYTCFLLVPRTLKLIGNITKAVLYSL